MDDRQRSLDLLNDTHEFPTAVMFKVIGKNELAFVSRVVATVREVIGDDIDPPFTTRETPNQRYVAVTLYPQILDAEQVLAVYERLRSIEGVILMM